MKKLKYSKKARKTRKNRKNRKNRKKPKKAEKPKKNPEKSKNKEKKKTETKHFNVKQVPRLAMSIHSNELEQRPLELNYEPFVSQNPYQSSVYRQSV